MTAEVIHFQFNADRHYRFALGPQPAPAKPSKPRMVPLTPELLQAIAAAEIDGLTSEMAGHPSFTMNALQDGLSFAMLDGGYLIAAGGLFPLWSQRWMGWGLVTSFARPRHLAFATRWARAWLDRKQRNPVFRRVEFTMLADQPWRESFAQALGVTEGLGPVACYDPKGRSHWLYARVVT